MKVLVFSDLQATEGHERCRSNPAVPLQRWRVEKFFNDLLAIYEEKGCEALWDLGDLLDDRSSVPVPTIETVLAGLSKFPKSPYNFKLIGNHEQYVRTTTVHAGRMFDPFFKVVSGRQVESIDLGPWSRTVAMCAFPEDDSAAAEWVASHARRDGILIGHFQVSGCRMGSGQALNGIPVSAVDRYGLALFGHVHLRQKVGQNAFYVGSPFQQDFGEADTAKYVAVVDLSTLEVEWVETSGFPSYKTVNLDGWMDRGPEDRCKVVLQSPAEAAEFYACPDCGEAEPVYSYELAARAVESGQGSSVTSINDLMKDYVQERPPAELGVDLGSEEMLDFGRHIIEAA